VAFSGLQLPQVGIDRRCFSDDFTRFDNQPLLIKIALINNSHIQRILVLLGQRFGFRSSGKEGLEKPRNPSHNVGGYLSVKRRQESWLKGCCDACAFYLGRLRLRKRKF